MEFTIEMLKKYNMLSLEGYKEMFGDNQDTELEFYRTFLIQTDHIPNKIIEAQILGKSADDYTEVLNLRKIARLKINELTATI